MSIMEGDTFRIEFTARVFESKVLSKYLEHRINDFLNDPEPQEDAFCENIPKDYLIELLTYLQGANKLQEAHDDKK